MHIGGVHRLTADRPIATLKLLHAHPGDRTQRLTLHRNHGLRDLFDRPALLGRREVALDHVDRYQWHVILRALGFTVRAFRTDGIIVSGGGPRCLKTAWRFSGDWPDVINSRQWRIGLASSSWTPAGSSSAGRDRR